MMSKKIIYSSAIILSTLLVGVTPFVLARQPLDGFEAHPPIHVRGEGNRPVAQTIPSGLSPAQIKVVYNLPSVGGSGTIAIIDAYNDPNLENDLNVFSSYYGLPSCTTKNGCFEKHLMAAKIRNDSNWGLEESLDTQWAHAIAPNAKILLVVAKSASGNDLLTAVDYARQRPDVAAISMSWGGSEFSGESNYDSHFISPTGATFFASSGDAGAGVLWPAVSSNVVGVGGTSLTLANGQLSSESAWSRTGGGLSQYEPAPNYQVLYGVPRANGWRAVPDVSYNADPNSGVSVYDSFGYQGVKGWFVVGGTSVGAPQWAAIKALSGTVSNAKLYQDASTAYATYFRDILTGSNGSCGFYCTAQIAYDYLTGLGSPITSGF